MKINTATYNPFLVLLIFTLIFAGFANIQSAKAQTDDDLIVTLQNEYERLAFDQAKKTFAKIMVRYSDFPPAELVKAHVLFAKVQFVQNRPDETEKQLRFALQLDPNLSLDRRQTSPKMIELFNRIKAELAASLTENPTPALLNNTNHSLRYILVQDRRPAAGLRSAVLPGWGQYYKGEQIKATVLAFGFGVGVISTINTQIKLNQARKDYQQATTTAEVNNRYADYDRWYKRRNFAAIAMGTIWVYSLIDALGNQQSRTSVSNFNFNASPAGVQFSYRF